MSCIAETIVQLTHQRKENTKRKDEVQNYAIDADILFQLFTAFLWGHMMGLECYIKVSKEFTCHSIMVSENFTLLIISLN